MCKTAPRHRQHCTFKERKLRRLAGRLQEAIRQEGLGHSQLAQQCYRHATQHWPPQCAPPSGSAVLDAQRIERDLAQLCSDEKTAALTDWRQKMQADCRAVSNWVAAPTKPQFSAILHPNTGVPSDCRTTALEHLKMFWQDIWQRPTLDVNEAMHTWRSAMPAISTPHSQPTIQPLALKNQSMKRQGKACGLDGWSATETNAWTMCIWNSFAVLVNHWLCQGQLPSVFRNIKQVHLPKEDCTVTCDAIAASSLRLISIQPHLWRVIAGCTASHQETKEWVAAWIPREFHGGIAGRGVHTALACLDSAMYKDDFLASLDLQKCFDHVSPQLACQVLRELRFPHTWAAAIESIWCHQSRWLQLFDTSLSEPVPVASSMPQGDALAPMALNAVTTGLFRAHELAMSRAGHAQPKSTIFLDDRSFVCQTQAQAHAAIDAWQQLAHAVGMKENAGKTKILVRQQKATGTTCPLPTFWFLRLGSLGLIFATIGGRP